MVFTVYQSDVFLMSYLNFKFCIVSIISHDLCYFVFGASDNISRTYSEQQHCSRPLDLKNRSSRVVEKFRFVNDISIISSTTHFRKKCSTTKLFRIKSYI